jgi:transglutaminase-like putative cysteine protease
MAGRSQQLSHDELRRLKWLLGGAMSLVALWTVFFLDVEALGLVGVAGGLIVAVLAWPQLPARVPALVWKLAVPGIIVAMAADFYFSPDTLPVLIRLAILLVLYRAVSYRRKREDLQLIVLSLFLVVVAGVLTVSLGFAFLLLLFTALGLGFLFVVNLLDAVEAPGTRTPEAETGWTRLGWGRFFARLRAVADWRLLGFAAVLFAAVVGMSGLLFMVIPRFELATGFFLDRYITRKSRTGFTDTVKFGDVSELIRDESVAMRVDLTDASGLREAPYWRLVVLDEYTPEGFKVSNGLKGELLRGQRVTQQLRGRQPGREINAVGGVWTFYVEPGVSRYLPLPGSYGFLRMRDVAALQFSAGHRVVALRTEPMTMTAYQLSEVELTPVLVDGRFPQLLQAMRDDPPRSADQFRYDPRVNLRGPVGPANEAVLRRVVGEITGGVELSAEEFTRRATKWLQDRHAYALSARLPAGEGRDGIVRWLDSNEPGFCEYFAASLAVLARAAGHPARVVAGFRGGVLNGFENYYMVRNSDAHAWVEIYDGKAAWVRADPTPGAVAASGTAEAAQVARQKQDSSWSARVDSLRVLWYRRIVSFDSRTQVQMLEQVKSFTTDSGAALRSRLEEWARRLKAWAGGPWDAARVLRALGTAGGGVALGWGLWRLGQWVWVRWQVWRRPQAYDPVRQKAGRWLGRMAECGTRNEEWQAVREDLRRLRYGRRETWPEAGAVFRRARRVRRLAGR